MPFAGTSSTKFWMCMLQVNFGWFYNLCVLLSSSPMLANCWPTAFPVFLLPFHNPLQNGLGEVRNIVYLSDGKSALVVYRATVHGTDAKVPFSCPGKCCCICLCLLDLFWVYAGQGSGDMRTACHPVTCTRSSPSISHPTDNNDPKSEPEIQIF